jgi:hypothetical protein
MMTEQYQTLRILAIGWGTMIDSLFAKTTGQFQFSGSFKVPVIAGDNFTDSLTLYEKIVIT